LEWLEDRLAPAVFNFGGPVLASVQAQAVFLGAGWDASASPPVSPTRFESFLGTTVNGTSTNPAPYLGMLKNAGYGITGAGSTATPVILDNVPVSGRIFDADIQNALLNAINAPGSKLQQPNANSLYVVFVQPNTVVDLGNGQGDSTNTFLAYHSWITTANGTQIPYAVLPFQGTAGNAQEPWLTSSFDSMTMAASHELAEAITDPFGTTWLDRFGDEIGDIVNGSTVYLNGFAVQREASRAASIFNFLPVTPTGATASHSVHFGISSGALQVTEAGATPFLAAKPTGETGTVVSVSVQGIDQFGQPMVDVVFSDHNAYEYHDFPPNNPTAVDNPSFFPWTPLGGNVKQAAAGQGVSYVLFTNGNLEEYVDIDYASYFYGYGVNPGPASGVIASGVTSIVAPGVDQIGANAVEYTTVVNGQPTTREWRDVSARSFSSTAGFVPATRHSDIVTGLHARTVPEATPDQTATDAASAQLARSMSASASFATPVLPAAALGVVPSTPGGQTQTSSNVALLQVAFATLRTGTDASLAPGFTAFVAAPPAGQASFVVTSQLSQAPLRLPESGGGNEEGAPVNENAGQQPALPGGGLQPNSSDGAAARADGLPPAGFTPAELAFLPEEFWTALGEPGSSWLLVGDSDSLGLSPAVILAFVLAGDRGVLGAADRPSRRRSFVL
jgi:hypothetical protein